MGRQQKNLEVDAKAKNNHIRGESDLSENVLERPKRRCVRIKTNLPSAAHYVGYVEDEEVSFLELEHCLTSP